jgi:tripartite-type tricarboxylate transporter receptor subunit TctC
MWQLSRKSGLGVVIGLLFLTLLIVSDPSCLLAQEDSAYPQKPIQLIVHMPAGGSVDTTARIVGEGAAKILGQPLVVINKAGGGGVLGALFAAKAKPDGYTILLSSVQIFASMYVLTKDIPYKLSDFDSICRLVTFPNIFVVKADAPWNSVSEFVDYARKNPQKVTYGSAGVGTSPHFVTELFKIETGLDIPHVPFKQGNEAATAILGNHIQFGILNEAHVAGPLKGGLLKALAVTGPKRLSSYPNVPTMTEAGYPRCVIEGYHGISAPVGLSKQIIKKLAGVFENTLKDPQMISTLEKNGLYPNYLGPEDYKKSIAEELSKFTMIAQKANIKMK